MSMLPKNEESNNEPEPTACSWCDAHFQPDEERNGSMHRDPSVCARNLREDRKRLWEESDELRMDVSRLEAELKRRDRVERDAESVLDRLGAPKRDPGKGDPAEGGMELSYMGRLTMLVDVMDRLKNERDKMEKDFLDDRESWQKSVAGLGQEIDALKTDNDRLAKENDLLRRQAATHDKFYAGANKRWKVAVEERGQMEVWLHQEQDRAHKEWYHRQQAEKEAENARLALWHFRHKNHEGGAEVCDLCKLADEFDARGPVTRPWQKTLAEAKRQAETDSPPDPYQNPPEPCNAPGTRCLSHGRDAKVSIDSRGYCEAGLLEELNWYKEILDRQSRSYSEVIGKESQAQLDLAGARRALDETTAEVERLTLLCRTQQKWTEPRLKSERNDAERYVFRLRGALDKLATRGRALLPAINGVIPGPAIDFGTALAEAESELRSGGRDGGDGEGGRELTWTKPMEMVAEGTAPANSAAKKCETCGSDTGWCCGPCHVGDPCIRHGRLGRTPPAAPKCEECEGTERIYEGRTNSVHPCPKCHPEEWNHGNQPVPSEGEGGKCGRCYGVGSLPGPAWGDDRQSRIARSAGKPETVPCPNCRDGRVSPSDKPCKQCGVLAESCARYAPRTCCQWCSHKDPKKPSPCTCEPCPPGVAFPDGSCPNCGGIMNPNDPRLKGTEAGGTEGKA